MPNTAACWQIATKLTLEQWGASTLQVTGLGLARAKLLTNVAGRRPCLVVVVKDRLGLS